MNGGPHRRGALREIIGQRKVPLARSLRQGAVCCQFLARRLAVQEMNARVQGSLPKKPSFSISIMKQGAVQALLSVESGTGNGV
jgi:hypothetical protein